MLTLPQGADGTREMYDGVSALHLPDLAEDLADLLEVLYDPRFATKHTLLPF